MQQAHPGSVVEEEVRAAARRELELLAPARPRPVRLSGSATGGKLARGDGDLLAAGARLAQFIPYRWRHAVVQLLRAGSRHGSPRFLSQRGGSAAGSIRMCSSSPRAPTSCITKYGWIYIKTNSE